MTQSQIEIVLVDRSQSGGGAPALSPLPPVPQGFSPEPQPQRDANRDVNRQRDDTSAPVDTQGIGKAVADSILSQDTANGLDDVTREFVEDMQDVVDSVERVIDSAEFIDSITGGAAAALRDLERSIERAKGGTDTGPSASVGDGVEDITRGAADALKELKNAIESAKQSDEGGSGINLESMGELLGSMIGRKFGVGGGTAAGRSIGGMLGRGAATAAAGGAAAAGSGTAAAGGAAAGGTAIATVATIAAPVAVVVAGLVAFGYALHKASEIAAALGDELEDISPEVAFGRAQADLARFQDRIDRGERIGGAVAQVEAARARLDEAMYEVQTEIYAILAKFAPAIEVGADTLTAILRGLISYKESLDVLISFGDKQQVEEARIAANNFAEAFKDIFRNDQVDNQDPIGDLLDLLKEGDIPEKPLRPNRKPGRLVLVK